MTPLAEAQAWLIAQLAALPPEQVPLSQAAGRTLAQPVPLQPSPTHPTATLNGLAIRAADTEGATDYAPIPINGAPVAPGDPMPPGADTVLEHTDGHHANTPAAPGHGVIPPGHDIPQGAILPTGTRLTPLHLALLSHDPLVTAQPRIAATTPFLQTLIIPTAATAPTLILTHGPLSTIHIPALAIRPGDTTALGHLGGTPAIRLPLHPAAAATVFALLVAPVLRRLAAQPDPTPVPATLTRKITSPLGQLDAVRVRLQDGQATPLGPPDTIGLLAATAANGLALVPEGSEGYPAGATVPIYPL